MNDLADKWWWRDGYQQLKATFRAEIAKFYPNPPSEAAVREIDERVKLRFRTFRRREEAVAFLYELGRRTRKPMKKLPQWPDLAPEKQNLLVYGGVFLRQRKPKQQDLLAAKELDDLLAPRPDDLLVPPFDVGRTLESVRHRGSGKDEDQKDQPVWTDPMAFSIRLSANDGTIVGAVKRLIRVQRKLHQVDKPKPNTGKRNRPRSWGYVEVLYRRKLGSDRSASSMLSKANSLAATYLTRRVVDVFLWVESGVSWSAWTRLKRIPPAHPKSKS